MATCSREGTFACTAQQISTESKTSDGSGYLLHALLFLLANCTTLRFPYTITIGGLAMV